MYSIQNSRNEVFMKKKYQFHFLYVPVHYSIFRVPTGSGIPGKVLEFYFQFPGPWKSWNFCLNPGKK